MANLRERKKEQTRVKIQNASFKIFENLGYEKATMGIIATEAEIGLGTLYNYFPSKTALFFSILEGNIESSLSELEKIINSDMTLLEALRAFFDVYMISFSTYGKNIWRDLFREIIFRDPMGYEKIKEIDQNFIIQLNKLLYLRTIEFGASKAEKISTASQALYSLLGFHILCFVTDSTVSLPKIIESLMEQTSFIMEGWISLENNRG
jgi:AcrR family transcriptional regulator